MKKQLYALILLFILLAGCQTEKQEEEKPETPSLQVSLTQINFLDKESSQAVTVTSSGEWRAVVSPSGTSSWLTLSETDGKAGSKIIQITASTNKEYDDRIASIKISTATTSQTISINQKKQSALLLSKNKYEVNKKGEKIEVIVQSNITFEVDIAQEAKSWITPVQTKGLSTHNLLFEIAPNSGYEARSSKIQIRENGGGLSETVNVFQVPDDALIVNKKETNISDAGGNILVELKTNIDYDVICPDKWISKITTKSIRTDKVTLLVEANSGYDSRKGLVIFKDRISYLADTLTIHQAQKGVLILSEKRFDLPLKGGIITIEVQSNIPHTITIPDDSKSWISNLSAKSLTSYNYSFSINPNQANNSRTGRIIIESEDKEKSDTIKINQEGKGDKELKALKVLYQEMGGDKWLNKNNWLSTRPVGEWYGIETNEAGFVRQINLSDNNLSGKIPAAIGAFESIEVLNLGSFEDSKKNNLTGTVPEELWNLKTLKKLELEKNKLSGELSSKIENLKNLEQFIIRDNELTGNIPSELGECLKLESLLLQQNRFSGCVPAHLMNLPYWGKLHPEENIFPQKENVVLSMCDGPVVDIPMLEVSTQILKFNGGNQTKNVTVTTNQPLWQFSIDNTIDWCSAIKDNDQLIISVNENTTNNSRNSTITVTAGSISKVINITQESLPKEDNYIDGEIVKLLSATQGDGIDLIFMGDGFTKTDLQKGGNYEAAIKKTIDHYFSIEPYKSYRNYFNAYMVVAESNEKGVSGEFKSKVDNKFESSYGDGTAISCNDEICKRYVSLIDDLDPLRDLSVILVLNSNKYAGTCMFWSDGFSIAMCPMSKEMPPYDFRGVVCHEAGGHGFAKLADEYIYHNQKIPASEVENCKLWKKWSANQNIDFTNDLSKIAWKDFIGIPKYDAVGAYEGAYYYKYGVWRPESNSCMNNNVPYYNAPSRWAIVKRIMQISGQELNFEMFVRTDRIDIQGQAYAKSKTQDKKMPPLSPPIYMK